MSAPLGLAIDIYQKINFGSKISLFISLGFKKKMPFKGIKSKNQNQKVDSEREIKSFWKVSVLIFKGKKSEEGVFAIFDIFSYHPIGAIMRHLKLG